MGKRRHTGRGTWGHSIASCIINSRLPHQIRYQSPRRYQGKHDHPSSGTPPTHPPTHLPASPLTIHYALINPRGMFPHLSPCPMSPSVRQSNWSALLTTAHEFRLDRLSDDGSEAWKMHVTLPH
ncbi:hypothetical protein E2C01_038032 [Portunus trituberculatus]|uniref:Uncharacterized protein n=1 Tax=Portunus trituberculatus TaxID=210409 RepID=A0A5B7FGI5_PORTR|nr:hypothetical protein [Portunus trituberculatus]